MVATFALYIGIYRLEAAFSPGILSIIGTDSLWPDYTGFEASGSQIEREIQLREDQAILN